MNRIKSTGTVVGLICALMLAGCDTMNAPSRSSGTYNNGTYDNSGYGSTNQYNQPTIYSGYGIVQSIELVRQDSQDNQGIGGSGVGLGAVAGAVVGGVVGHQVGSGSGNTAATIIGAVGGAYLGNELENRQQQQYTEAYRVTVRMENRTTQTLLLSNNPGFRVGDRVRISNGVMERY